MALSRFSDPVRTWFDTTFPEPTAAQAQGWPAIVDGDHTLIDEISIGGIVLRDIKASINPAMSPNEPALLGMSALKNVELRQRNGELQLIQS